MTQDWFMFFWHCHPLMLWLFIIKKHWVFILLYLMLILTSIFNSVSSSPSLPIRSSSIIIIFIFQILLIIQLFQAYGVGNWPWGDTPKVYSLSLSKLCFQALLAFLILWGLSFIVTIKSTVSLLNFLVIKVLHFRLWWFLNLSCFLIVIGVYSLHPFFKLLKSGLLSGWWGFLLQILALLILLRDLISLVYLLLEMCFFLEPLLAYRIIYCHVIASHQTWL